MEKLKGFHLLAPTPHHHTHLHHHISVSIPRSIGTLGYLCILLQTSVNCPLFFCKLLSVLVAQQKQKFWPKIGTVMYRGSTLIKRNSPFLGHLKKTFNLCCTNLPEDDISISAVSLCLLSTLQQHNSTTGDVFALP